MNARRSRTHRGTLGTGIGARRLASRGGLLRLSVAATAIASCAHPSPTSTLPVSTASRAEAAIPHARPSAPPSDEQHIEVQGTSYVFRASRLTNLAWQLDCLAGLGRCSRAAYEELWADRLSAEPELRAGLTRWAELRNQLRGPVAEPHDSRSLLPLPQARADLWQRVRLASVIAVDLAEYRSDIYTLTDAQNAEALSAVLSEFDGRFSTIWQRALPVLQRAMSEQVGLFGREDVALTARRVAAFYGGVGATPTMHFDLLYRPEHPSSNFGTQVLDHGLIEVVAGAKPQLAVQPPIHEMFHYLFASAPFAKLDELASRFADSPNPDSLAAFGLLDEVLATGLAQGVIGRELAPTELEARLATARGLYDDRFIDAVSKALLPQLSALLQDPANEGMVFSAQFQTAYLAAVQTAFPRGLPPAAQLRPLACVYSKSLEQAYRALSVASGSRLVASSDQLDDEEARSLLEGHATWGRVLLLKPDELAALSRYRKSLTAASVALIRASARHDSRFAHATRVRGSGPFFVLVADDDAQAKTLVGELMALDAMFDGIALAHPGAFSPASRP